MIDTKKFRLFALAGRKPAKRHLLAKIINSMSTLQVESKLLTQQPSSTFEGLTFLELKKQ
ncbi:hypothetical protein D9M71_737720 [compost metagenome]